MNVSLEEQLRSLAAASLGPEGDDRSSPSGERRSTRAVWLACAAALVVALALAGMVLARVDGSRTPATASDPAEPSAPGGLTDLVGLEAPPLTGTATDGTPIDCATDVAAGS